MKKTATIIAAALLWPLFALAQSMSSSSYKIPFDDLSGGGSYGTSSSYKLTDTVSEQASPSGEGMTSTSYRTCAGFHCLRDSSTTSWTVVTSSIPCTDSTTGTAPFAIGLGTLSRSAVTTAADHVCVRVTTAASAGVSVGVSGANGGLKSTSQPAEIVDLFTGTLSGATEGYGICSTATANGFTASSPFNGSCDTSTNHVIGGPTTALQTIYTATGPVTNGRGDILIKAGANGTTLGLTDYSDTLTFIVAPTF
jgi:hypothetical protein